MKRNEEEDYPNILKKRFILSRDSTTDLLVAQHLLSAGHRPPSVALEAIRSLQHFRYFLAEDQRSECRGDYEDYTPSRPLLKPTVM